MIIVDCEQNTPEWNLCRIGIPTASEFPNIITSKGLRSASIDSNLYMNKLLGEWLSGKPDDHFTNKYMDRGHEVEGEARNYLEFQIDREIEKVGFIYKDERKLVGSSPDGLVVPAIEGLMADTGCEIKCPIMCTQIKYLLAGKVPIEFIPQIQGSMWVTGFEHWYFISYHPDLPQVIKYVERDDEYINKLSMFVDDFVGKMLQKREILISMGYKPAQLQEAA